jgi:hypothetical protein
MPEANKFIEKRTYPQNRPPLVVDALLRIGSDGNGKGSGMFMCC